MAAPGIIFVSIRDLWRPKRDQTNLRETAAVLLVGLASDLIVLLLVSGINAVSPGFRAPDAGALLQDPTRYLLSELPFLSWWTLEFLLLACMVSIGLARAGGPVGRVGDRDL
jgi:hypothetical protein